MDDNDNNDDWIVRINKVWTRRLWAWLRQQKSTHLLLGAGIMCLLLGACLVSGFGWGLIVLGVALVVVTLLAISQ